MKSVLVNRIEFQKALKKTLIIINFSYELFKISGTFNRGIQL